MENTDESNTFSKIIHKIIIDYIRAVSYQHLCILWIKFARL